MPLQAEQLADAGRGRTVMFATHYLEEADEYADRIVLIRRGRIVADGTPAYVKSLAAGRTVRATLPDADQIGLLDVPGVTSVEVRGDTVLLRTSDSDATARFLLTRTAAHDLEVTAHSLEPLDSAEGDMRLIAAAKIGGTRLIDNLPVTTKSAPR